MECNSLTLPIDYWHSGRQVISYQQEFINVFACSWVGHALVFDESEKLPLPCSLEDGDRWSRLLIKCPPTVRARRRMTPGFLQPLEIWQDHFPEHKGRESLSFFSRLLRKRDAHPIRLHGTEHVPCCTPLWDILCDPILLLMGWGWESWWPMGFDWLVRKAKKRRFPSLPPTPVETESGLCKVSNGLTLNITSTEGLTLVLSTFLVAVWKGQLHSTIAFCAIVLCIKSNAAHVKSN